MRRWEQQSDNKKTSRAHRRAGPILMLLAALAFLLAPPAAEARRVAYQAAPGVWRTKESPAAGKAARRAGTLPYTTNHILWNITYLDPAGQGFNDPAAGAARQAVVTRVLDYISQVLNYPSGTLDITFAQRPETDPEYLSIGGTYFPTGLGSGFFGGDALTHISTGIDPDPGLEDIYCLVDFSYPWYTGTGTPGSGDYDLTSALLHEITHGLGLVSLMQADGTSALTGTNPGVYSLWDNLLGLSDGTRLFGAGGHFTGDQNDLLGSTPGVVFLGSHAKEAFGGIWPPIYTPYPFEMTSSLSHWTVGIPGGGVMEPNAGPGVVKRAYAPIDRYALWDLGWRVQPLPPLNAAGGGWQHYQ